VAATPNRYTTHIDNGNPLWRTIWRCGYFIARRWGRLMRLVIAMRVPSFDREIVELALVGRRTGRPRPVLVTLLQVDGRWYVGHPNGPAAWLANLAASPSVSLTIPRQPPLRVRSIPLGVGPERTSVIWATATQQPIPFRPIYRASRSHIMRAGVYHRLEIVPDSVLPPTRT
jgi:hypothetical protein